MEIETGQHFREVRSTLFGRLAPEFVTYRVFVGTDGVQHVQVYSRADPTERKTLSAAVLKDRRRFVLVAAPLVPLK
jgi:hypothetical protein